jgi:hypothetical protein
MPTVLRVGPYGFVFFSSDRGEPPHIHVRRDKNVAKYWLQPISIATNRGFAQHELNDIERIILQYQTQLVEAWNEFFRP